MQQLVDLISDLKSTQTIGRNSGVNRSSVRNGDLCLSAISKSAEEEILKIGDQMEAVPFDQTSWTSEAPLESLVFAEDDTSVVSSISSDSSSYTPGHRRKARSGNWNSSQASGYDRDITLVSDAAHCVMSTVNDVFDDMGESMDCGECKSSQDRNSVKTPWSHHELHFGNDRIATNPISGRHMSGVGSRVLYPSYRSNVSEAGMRTDEVGAARMQSDIKQQASLLSILRSTPAIERFDSKVSSTVSFPWGYEIEQSEEVELVLSGDCIYCESQVMPRQPISADSDTIGYEPQETLIHYTIPNLKDYDPVVTTKTKKNPLLRGLKSLRKRFKRQELPSEIQEESKLVWTHSMTRSGKTLYTQSSDESTMPTDSEVLSGRQSVVFVISSIMD